MIGTAVLGHVVHGVLIGGPFLCLIVILVLSRCPPGDDAASRADLDRRWPNSGSCTAWTPRLTRKDWRLTSPVVAPKPGVIRFSGSFPWSSVALGVCSVSAGLIHAGVVADHFAESRLFGQFFVALAIAQLAWVGWLARCPTPTAYVAGVILNGAALLIWVLSRTIGLRSPQPASPSTWGSWTAWCRSTS